MKYKSPIKLISVTLEVVRSKVPFTHKKETNKHINCIFYWNLNSVISVETLEVNTCVHLFRENSIELYKLTLKSTSYTNPNLLWLLFSKEIQIRQKSIRYNTFDQQFISKDDIQRILLL